MKKLAILLVLALLLPRLALCAEIGTIDQAGLASLIEKNRGKVVMLNFFATWCPPCRAEIPEIVKLRAAWPEDKLFIAGLSVDDDKAAVPPFLKKLGVNYPVWLADRSAAAKYNVTSVPHNAFIAPNGKLIISEPGMADANVLAHVVSDLLK